MKRTKILKLALLSIPTAILCALGMILFSKYLIDSKSEDYIYNDVSKIPACKTALVLGCSPKFSNGSPNLYFTYRMQKAFELYQAGKVTSFIVSGDNGTKYYNEPVEMTNALVELGIPKSIIYQDYAGFRTLDSVVRAKEIFSQTKLIVVSQEFHNRRAIFIGQSKGMELFGINATSPPAKSATKTDLRERLARVKTLLDLWLLNKQPKFLGEKIEISAY